MRKDIKELADAMEKGWKKVPVMYKDYFWTGSRTNPTACCARGHAGLGYNGDPEQGNIWGHFEKLLDKQKVTSPNPKNKFNLTLAVAIDALVLDYNWDTPKVIKWLRSHQND